MTLDLHYINTFKNAYMYVLKSSPNKQFVNKSCFFTFSVTKRKMKDHIYQTTLSNLDHTKKLNLTSP